MAIEAVFNTFYDNLTVDNEEDIFQKIKRIIKILNKELYGIDCNTEHSYIIGSFGRNTAIKGISEGFQGYFQRSKRCQILSIQTF